MAEQESTKSVSEAVSADWLRSVALSGIILAVGVHPLVAPFLKDAAGLYELSASALLVVEIVLFGLTVNSASQPIYYLYEGFLLPSVTSAFEKRNRRRLERAVRQYNGLLAKPDTKDRNDRLDILFETIREYPIKRLDGEPVRYVDRPTRLGNAIATYEGYAESRYGVDGVTFWHHLLTKGPDALSAAFARQIEFADSLVLASFSAGIVAVLYAVVMAGFVVGIWCTACRIGTLHFGIGFGGAILTGSTVLTWLFYRLAIPAHLEAGTVLQAEIDLAMPGFVEWLKSHEATIEDARHAEGEKVRDYLVNLGTDTIRME